MIGKPIALIQVPNQRLFSVKQAACYLGKHENTIRKMADLGQIAGRMETDAGGRRHRVFTLEALDSYIESLPSWYDSPHGEKPGARKEKSHGYL